MTLVKRRDMTRRDIHTGPTIAISPVIAWISVWYGECRATCSPSATEHVHNLARAPGRGVRAGKVSRGRSNVEAPVARLKTPRPCGMKVEVPG